MPMQRIKWTLLPPLLAVIVVGLYSAGLLSRHSTGGSGVDDPIATSSRPQSTVGSSLTVTNAPVDSAASNQAQPAAASDPFGTRPPPLKYPEVVAAAIPPSWDPQLQFPKRKVHPVINQDAYQAVQKVSGSCFDYFRTFSGMPIGTNSEITEQLLGKNPKKMKFIDAKGLSINEKGELLDLWGSPYFFHQVSKSYLEIRSAGEDKLLWTADDDYF